MVMRRHRFCFSGSLRGAAAAPVLTAVALLAGCSADIRRLEQPTYALGEKPLVPAEPVGRRNAGAPPAYDNPGWPNSGPLRQSSDRVTALPDVAPIQSSPNPSVPFDAPRKPKAAAAPVAARASVPVAAGNTIDIQPGDTLFGVSKRHHVSIAALMELNQLKSATLHPGQKLVLPANARRPLAKPAAAPAPAPVAAAPITPSPAPAPAAAAAPTDWDGNYVVKAGDSLFGIARAHKVNSAELQRVNGITDPAKMRLGMTLKVPSGSAAPAAGQAPLPPPIAVAPVAAAPAPVQPAPRAAASGGPRILNPQATAPTSVPPTPAAAPAAAAPAPTKVAAVGPVALPAAAAKFRWPAKGALLAGFGKRPDGAHNDGMNISAAAGSEIAAAEAGTVAYTGSEIKAYGNLVLIRHEGGWVTAYAHASEILVKRGDTVTRGQVIAKVGATGTVDRPQLHFELRQGSKPVDPAPHMEK